jgi:hypothetical protein
MPDDVNSDIRTEQLMVLGEVSFLNRWSRSNVRVCNRARMPLQSINFCFPSLTSYLEEKPTQQRIGATVLMVNNPIH